VAASVLTVDVDPFQKPVWPKAYSFALVTGVLFVASWAGQFVFQAVEFGNDAREHGQAFEWAQYWPAFLAATFENWQSEAAQIIWQVAGLAWFYHWGSTQSREGEQRIEAKLDELLRRGDPPA
jgi:hypothetical protein